MNHNNISGTFIIIGFGLLVISMGFNYTAFAGMSNVLIQQIAFIGMALLFDSLKISSAVGCRYIWAMGHYIIASFTLLAFISLTGISIIAGYVYLTNINHQKSAENLKESLTYKMSLNSVNQAQSEVDSLIQFASVQQAKKKKNRLVEIEKLKNEYNAKPVKNYNNIVVGNFGQWNKCGIGQSRYNLYCSEVDTLSEEGDKIHEWLNQHDSYLSAIAVVGQRQQAFVNLGSTSISVGLTDSIQIEPFVSFTRWFNVKYEVALSVSMFILAVFCELFATMCFVNSSLFSTKTTSITIPTKKTGQIDKIEVRRKDTPGASFGCDLSVSKNNPEVRKTVKQTPSITDGFYKEITNIITNGICPPTRHSLKKHYNMTKKQTDIFQSKWINDGLIEQYDKPNGIRSYRLISS